MTRINRFVNILIIALALGFSIISHPSKAAEGNQVTMRSSLEADGARLLIEWSAPIKVLQKREKNGLILRFSRPLSLDAKPALDLLTTYLDIEKTVIDGTDLTLKLRSGVSAKLELKDRKVVAIDFDREQQDVVDIKLNVSTLENGVRLTLEWPQPISFDIMKPDKKLLVTFDARNRINSVDMDYLNKTLQPWFDEIRQTANPDSTSLTLGLRPMIVSAVASKGERRVDIDLKRDASKLAERPEDRPAPNANVDQAQNLSGRSNLTFPPLPKRRPEVVVEPEIVNLREMIQAVSSDQSRESEKSVDELVFDWKHSVGAAVFKRAGYLWVVFDTPPAFSRTPLPPPAPSSLMPGELIDADRATVIRFQMVTDTDTHFDVVKDSTGRWLISPNKNPKTVKSIPIIPTSKARTLKADATSNGRIILVKDPLVGDQIGVWPILKAGVGQPTPRRLVDMEVFASLQGLAWRPLNDKVVTTARPHGLEFSRAGGLKLSNSSGSAPLPEQDLANGERSARAGSQGLARRPRESDASDRVAAFQQSQAGSEKASSLSGELSDDVTPSSYLALADSGVERELVAETRRILRQAILKAPPHGKDEARLNLAKLLVAEKLASEAKIVLGRISDDSKDTIATSSQALRGASAFLTNDLDEASALLGASKLDNDEEIRIWRAALDAREQNWEAAAEGWKTSSNRLDAYPSKLRLEFGLLALESAIEINDEKMIRQGLRRLNKLELTPYETARVDRLRASIALRDGDLERAEEILKILADGRYPGLSTLADFELASLVQRRDSDNPQHLAVMKKRLPLWRGHPQEINMIDDLAALYRDANNPGEALRLWGHLARIYPKTEEDDRINHSRRATYVDALTKLAGKEINLLEAYTIYLDFIELLPDSSEIQFVHRDLARHLAGLDLLEEAVLVLQPMLESIDDEEERLRIGVEVADHLLVLDRANEALSTLDRLGYAAQNTTSPLENEHKILKARALLKLERSDEALNQLQDLQTSAAHHVRANIFWQQQNWNRLASSIEQIIDDPALSGPLSDETQKLVLWLALAREELGQTEKLDELRQRYAAEMASGPWADAFVIGTQSQSQQNDIETALRQTEKQLADFTEFRENATLNR